MQYYISKYFGFCFGVNLAVAVAHKHAKEICLLGKIVHNSDVMENLIKNGVVVANSVEEAINSKRTKVLIRAHGVAKNVIDELIERKFEIIDKTCPKVKKIHAIVQNAAVKKQKIIIAGNPNHPEIIGICGWCGNICPNVIQDIESAKKILNSFNFQNNCCVVAQTTFNFEKYKEICDFLCFRIKNADIYNTICHDTIKRQMEITKMAPKFDAVVVVGSKQSSNTLKLFEIAQNYCKNTILAENLIGIDFKKFQNFKKIAFFSGASTPIESIKKEFSLSIILN